jgi:hypothetical protein
MEGMTMPIRFVALETAVVRSLQAGGLDANGQLPEKHVSSGAAPCRHCLHPVAAGEPFLIVAHRPFPAPQPYAEQGPIFLHAAACPRGGGSAVLPSFLGSPRYIVRGYDHAHRIVYGSGQILETPNIPNAAAEMFGDLRIEYIHVRSATNNCYHCRIERA